MKKRIWIYNDRAKCGGSEIVLTNVANCFARRGHDVIIITDKTSKARICRTLIGTGISGTSEIR